MSDDEWQKEHNRELARKQREENDRLAQQRQRQQQEDQYRKSKKMTADAHKRANEQLNKNTGCLLFLIFCASAIFLFLSF